MALAREGAAEGARWFDDHLELVLERTGRLRVDLIREGVRRVTAEAEPGATFTTQGVPSLLTPPSTPVLLPIPAIVFPALVESTLVSRSAKHPGRCRKGYTRNRNGKCVRAKRARARKATRPTRKRTNGDAHRG